MRSRRMAAALAGLAGTGLVLSGGGAASSPPGGGWTPPEAVSTGRSVSGLADVEVGPNGEMAAVWADGGVVRVARRGTDGAWAAPTRLSPPRYPEATYPRLAYDGTGRLTAAWIYGIQGSEMYIQYRRTRPDGRWGGEQFVGQWDYGYYSKLELAGNAGGDLLFGWLTRRGVYLADKAGTHFPASKTVRHVDAFDLALSDNGLRVAALATDDGTTQTLSVIRKQVGGSWSAPEVLWSGTGGAALPAPGVWVDAGGVATVVWRQPGSAQGWDLVAARAAEGAGWSAPEVVRAKVGRGPMVVDGTPDGDVLVVFGRYARKVEAARYAGAWSTPVVLGAADPAVKDLDAALSPDGRAVAVFSPQRAALGDGVLVRVGGADGTWGPPITLLAPGRSIARGSLHAGADHGDLLAAWSQRRADGSFVVTARVREAG